MELLFELGAIVVALAAFGGWISAANHESFLAQICEGTDATYLRNINGTRFRYIARIKFQERALSLSYTFRLWQATGNKKEELEIAVPLIQKFWLRLLPRMNGPSARNQQTQPAEEIAGIPAIVHSNQPEAAKEFLTHPEIARQFESIGPFHKLEIYRGVLRVIYREPVAYFSTASLQTALNAISQLVFYYEQQPSFRLVAIATSELCPFCRGKLDSSQESIFECGECGTHLHEACWKENRHCTTWGCPSITALPLPR